MSVNKIRLNKLQIAFVVEMTEIKDHKKAVEKFATIMIEEKMSPADMGTLIDRIMEKQAKK
jgi:hypothetical protein